MCLSRLAPELKSRRRTGWKVLQWTEDDLISPCIGNEKPFPRGVWAKERNYRPNYSRHNQIGYGVGPNAYPKGFHIFLTKEGAEDWRAGGQVIEKVKFRYPVAYGYQYTPMSTDNPVVVAKQMMIPEEVTDDKGSR